MQTPQRKVKDIRRLLSAFPATSQADPALVLHNYLMAVDDWHADLVEDAVTLIIKGQLPGHDGRFAPTAPMVSTACRLVAEQQARASYLARCRTPALPPPDINHTEEERARAKAKVQAFVETQGAIDAHVNAEQLAAQKDRWEKVNAYFQPPMDEESLAERLNLRRTGTRYSPGSPESEENAA